MLTNKTQTAVSYTGRYAVWRMIYILIFTLLLAGMGLTYYFIYQNIYSTIANTNAITALKSNVNIYNLDLAGFQKASVTIEKKQKLEYFSPDTRNVFYYGAPGAATSTPTSTVTSTYANTSTNP